MACDNGVWDNPDPCREKVPHCPTEVDNVRFYRTCTYQNDEVCNFFCQNGLVSVHGSYSMLCTNGSWEFEQPCIAPSTASQPTGYTSSKSQGHSTSTLKTSTQSGTLSSKEQRPDAVPIAVGVTVGIVVLTIVVVVTFVFIFKRRQRHQDSPPFREFHSPFYQGLDNASTTSGVPSSHDDNQRPDTIYDQLVDPKRATTYDLITFDQPGTSSTDDGGSSSIGKRFPNDTVIEYKTFGGSEPSEPSIYLHPASERRDRGTSSTDSKASSTIGKQFPNDTGTEYKTFGGSGTSYPSIYLHPVSERDVENFM